MSNVDKYLEKVYAGILGKAIGVRLGIPMEGYSSQKIYEVYGEIDNYVKDFKKTPADDDTNGTLFFIRALDDYGYKGKITAEDIGNSWLNYTPNGHGIFWWGGYGVSTEHTAYINLKNGIKAPYSGCIEKNGKTVAEQIGGQIFIDCWGLIAPDNINKAAEYAQKAASVSHDGEAVNGAMFIAACISRAFVQKDMKKVVNEALSVINDNSEFKNMALNIIDFYNKNSDDFRKCFEFLKENYGYDKYPGACHVMPNAGVIILSLLYGENDFSKTIEIAVMCGWDTDCNAGNVGTIIGTACGLDEIDAKWRKPINDVIIASSLIGTLNIVDIPTYSKYIANLGLMVNDKSTCSYFSNEDKINFDFSLSGSTHGFRSSDDSKCELANEIFENKNALRLKFNLKKNEKVKVYYKPFYRAEDFDDFRYPPNFSSQINPNEIVELLMTTDSEIANRISVFSYVRDTNSKKEIICKENIIKTGINEVRYTVPDTDGNVIDEAGLIIEANENILNDSLFIERFRTYGKCNYDIDIAKEHNELNGVTDFTYSGGKIRTESGILSAITPDFIEIYTGNYYLKNYVYKAKLKPIWGTKHNINFRVKGSRMGYAAGFNDKNNVTLYKNNNGYKEIMSKFYQWKMKDTYEFMIKAIKNQFEFYINGDLIFKFEDNEHPFLNGCVGFTQLEEGHAEYSEIHIKEI